MKGVLNNPTFLRGLFNILIVAIIVTIFELLFYYYIVAPDIVRVLDNLLTTTELPTLPPISTAPPVANASSPPNANSLLVRGLEYLQGILKGMSESDEELNNYTNSLKAGIMGMVVAILFVLLLWIYNKLRRNVKGDRYGTDLVPATITTIITLVLLLGFQIFMYFFALKFQYTNTDEIDLRFINSLLKDQGREDEMIKLPSGTSLDKV